MADIDRVVIYRRKRLLDVEPQWRWNYVAAGNNERLANGGESYHDFTDCVTSAGRVVGFDWSNVDGTDAIEARGNQRSVTRVYHVQRAGGGLLAIWVVTSR